MPSITKWSSSLASSFRSHCVISARCDVARGSHVAPVFNRCLPSLVILAAAAGLSLTACNESPAVNPWRDDALPTSTYATPSSTGILAEEHAPAIRTRAIPERQATTVTSKVPHYPLWWEDPFEDKGDGDHQFAVTWADYLDMPYGLGRFILNTVGWPASAVVQPPGLPMVSDSVIGRDHDATPGKSLDPTAGPADFQDAVTDALPAESSASDEAPPPAGPPASPAASASTAPAPAPAAR